MASSLAVWMGATQKVDPAGWWVGTLGYGTVTIYPTGRVYVDYPWTAQDTPWEEVSWSSYRAPDGTRFAVNPDPTAPIQGHYKVLDPVCKNSRPLLRARTFVATPYIFVIDGNTMTIDDGKEFLTLERETWRHDWSKWWNELIASAS